jgi:hypothetical protein
MTLNIFAVMMMWDASRHFFVCFVKKWRSDDIHIVCLIGL